MRSIKRPTVNAQRATLNFRIPTRHRYGATARPNIGVIDTSVCNASTTVGCSDAAEVQIGAYGSAAVFDSQRTRYTSGLALSVVPARACAGIFHSRKRSNTQLPRFHAQAKFRLDVERCALSVENCKLCFLLSRLVRHCLAGTVTTDATFPGAGLAIRTQYWSRSLCFSKRRSPR